MEITSRADNLRKPELTHRSSRWCPPGSGLIAKGTLCNPDYGDTALTVPLVGDGVRCDEGEVMSLYRYTLTFDTGFAPNPYGGYCTLAACKPQIREHAQVGDWVAGFGSAGRGRAGQLVYAMRVAETMTFEEYWNDPRFEAKKPKCSARYEATCGDNVYHRALDGSWLQEPCFHCSDHMGRDLGVNKVLVATEFVYYGDRSIELPAEIACLGERRFTGIRGHRVNDLPHDAVETVIFWLRDLCSDGGIKGSPAQRQQIMASGQDSGPSKRC